MTDVSAINARLASDPVYQQLVNAAGITPGTSILKDPTASARVKGVYQYVQSHGGIPNGYSVNPQTGVIEKDTPTNWWRALAPLILVGGGIALGGGLGGFGGAGAEAGGGGLPEGVTLEGLSAGPGSTSVPVAGAVEEGVSASDPFGAAAMSQFDDPGTVFDAAGGFTGPSSVVGANDVATPPGPGAPGYDANGSPLLTTAEKIDKLLRAASAGAAGATNAAGNNRVSQSQFGLNAERQFRDSLDATDASNRAYDTDLTTRSMDETSQRHSALQDVARASFLENQTPGPFNPKGITALSPQYRQALDNTAGYGSTELSAPPAYAIGGLPYPKAPAPAQTAPAPWIPPSTLEQVGSWVGPGLTTADLILQFLQRNA